MKTQRKIITDRPLITDNEILKQRKPFKEILTNYYNQGAGTGNGFSSIAAFTTIGLTLLITGAMIYFFTNKPNETLNEMQVIAQKSDTITDSLSTIESNPERKIKPPFKEYISYEIFKIRNNNKPAKLKTKNGTVITIPKNAFTDSSGNRIKSDITIKYRDFYNPLDFFLSGIPMDYDSLGTNYTFTSAGMFEINAVSGKKQLYLKKGKKIELKFVSKYKDTYNIYYYDTINNEWNFSYPETKSSLTGIKRHNNSDSILFNDYTFSHSYRDTATNTEKDFMKIIELVNNKYLKTGKPDNYAFPADTSMLKGTAYEGIDSLMLEITDGQGFDKSYYSVLWDKVSINGDAGNLSLVLQKGDKKLNFNVIPVIDKTKYNTAKKRYELFAKEEEIRAGEQRKRNKLLRKVDKSVNEWLLTRTVSVSRLGIFNFDKPVPKPEYAMEGKGNIVDENGKKLYFDEIFITQPVKNILWNYTNKWLYSNPARLTNIGWFITRDKRLALIYPEYFHRKPDTIVVAKVYNTEEGIEALRQLLN